MVWVGGGPGWWRLVGASAWCVSGPVPGEGRGRDGRDVGLLVAGGAGVGAVLDESLGVPPGPLGVVCAPKTKNKQTGTSTQARQTRRPFW